MSQPFALAVAILGALLLVLAWVAAWQTGLLPAVAICTVGGAVVAGLLHSMMRGRR